MKSFFADHPVILTSLRWIMFIPVGLAGGIISAYVWRFFLSTGYAGSTGEVLHELRLTNGFAGNFILGPVLVIGEMAVTSFCAMFAALYIVPKSRAVVGGILIGMLLMMGVFSFIMQGSQFEFFFPFEARIRFCLEWIGLLVGSVFAIKGISSWLQDYVRDGVYNLDEAVDQSWNSLMIGKVLEKINDIERSRQFEIVKDSPFYSGLTKESQKVIANELCSLTWSGSQNEELITAILCKILEIEMRKEVCSWHLSIRQSLEIPWKTYPKGSTQRNKFEKFCKSKKIKSSSFSLGELLNIYEKLRSLLNSNDKESIAELQKSYSNQFLTFLRGSDFQNLKEPLRLFRNAMAHGNKVSERSIDLGHLIGSDSLESFFELKDHEMKQGILSIFLNRKLT